MFIVPPKQILKDSDVLFDLGFYTRGKIFISCENFEFSQETILKFCKPLPTETVSEKATKRVYQTSSSPISSNITRNTHNSNESSSPKTKKVPKWFKIGK